MKKKNDQTLKEAMSGMLQEFKLSKPLNENRIKSLWEKLMGRTIATYTSDIKVRQGVLYLSILSAPLKQDLLYSREQIKNLINEELGEEFIKEVVIR